MTDGPAGPEPIRLALVDDHELVREGLRALVEAHAGDDVVVVYSGFDVLRALATEPSLVLLDVDLGPDTAPVQDSTAACVRRGARVLLISAFDDASAIRAALAAGALGFIPKRVSVDVLLEALHTAAAGELYLSVDLATILMSTAGAPDLSARELEALRLYAAGLKVAAVAHRMGVSPHTAKEYLDRVRAKYRQAGRAASTRTDLYAAARTDGLLAADRPLERS